MSTLVEDFKTAFRGHPTGVALITARTPDGPFGLTASSVASVSVDPPALSFSVTKSNGSAGGVLTAPSILVHFLGDRHADLAEAFARPGSPRFTPEQGWEMLSTGEPYFAAAPVALRARVVATVPAGSSRLVLAEVIGVHHGPEATRLMYQDRRFFSVPPVI